MRHIDNLSKTYERNDGLALEFAFENGYGASVIKGPHTYGGKNGLWELAVLKGSSLCYTTHITDDVLGHLSWEDVENTLDEIQKL